MTCKHCGRHIQRTGKRGRPPSVCEGCAESLTNSYLGVGTCGNCGTHYPVLRSGSGAYCSKACQASAERMRFTCEGCGNRFGRHKSGSANRYCSRKCAFDNRGCQKALSGYDSDAHAAVLRKRMAGWKVWICRWTGKAMPRGRRGYIDRDAKVSHKRWLYKHRYFTPVDKVEKPCARCGRVRYESAKKNPPDVCGNCSSKWRREALKRAQSQGVEVSNVIRAEVFRRDRFVCYLCGKLCIKKMEQGKHYDPDLATVDHVIPLSKGGPHSMENVRCACWDCNGKKSDAMPVAGGGHTQ